MLYARDFRQIAREGLQDRWLLAVGTGLVAGIMGGIAPGHGRGITYYLPESEHVIPQLRTTLFLLFVVVFIYMAVTFVIGGAVSMGHAKFNLRWWMGKMLSLEICFPNFTELVLALSLCFGRRYTFCCGPFCSSFRVSWPPIAIPCLITLCWNILSMGPGKPFLAPNR